MVDPRRTPTNGEKSKKDRSMSKALIAIATASLAAGSVHAMPIWQVGNSSYVLHPRPAQLQDSSGRAELLRAVERAAERLCKGAGPRRAEMKCMAERLAAAERSFPATVRRAIDMARSERRGQPLPAR
jgi:UrcA family protein